MLVVPIACEMHGAICRVECETSGRGNWWVRSMKNAVSRKQRMHARKSAVERAEARSASSQKC